MSYNVIKSSKITAIEYTKTIEEGKTYNFGGYQVKIAEFMTVRELFSRHDSVPEAMEYKNEFCKNHYDEDYFGDDIVVVFTNADDDENSTVYLPLQNLLDLIGK